MYKNVREATEQQKADILIIGGHGTPTSTDFGGVGGSPKYVHDPITGRLRQSFEHNDLDLSDEKEMANPQTGISRLLKDGGQVILISCSTGKGRDEQENMTNMMYRVFPQASHVWAPTKDVVYEGLEFDSNGQIFRPKYYYLGEGNLVYDAANPEQELPKEDKFDEENK